MAGIRFDGNCKHQTLKEWLRREIVSGRYQPGDRLPSDNELAREHGISNATIRAAIASLVHEGLVQRIQGRGTFVLERRPGPIDVALVLPHLYAEVLQQGASSPDIMPRLVSAIEDEARKNDADIILYLDHGSAAKERRNLQGILDRSADAALVFYTGGMQNLDVLSRVRDSGVPMVMLDRYIRELETDYVGTDNALGMRMAVGELVEHGFTTIHYFEIPTYFCTSELERRDAYIEACMEFQLVPNIHEILPGSNGSDRPAGWDESASRTLVSRIMDNRSGPIALFAENGPVMRLVWRAAQPADLSRDEVAIGSFDEPFIGIPDDILHVEVIQPLEEIGRASVRTLIDRLKGKTGTTHLKVEPWIRVSGR